MEDQTKKVFCYLAHGFPILWRGARDNAEGLVIPHVPEDKATQFLPLAGHLLQHVANPDVPISAKLARVNEVRF